MSQPPPFLEPTGGHGAAPPAEPAASPTAPAEQPPEASTAADVIGWGTVLSGAAICLGAFVGPFLVGVTRNALELAERSPGLEGAYAGPLQLLAFYDRHVWWFVISQLALGIGIIVLGRALLNRRRWALPVLVAVATVAWIGGLGYIQRTGNSQPDLADPLFQRLTSFGVTVNIVITTALYAGLLFALTRRPVREAFRRSEPY